MDGRLRDFANRVDNILVGEKKDLIKVAEDPTLRELFRSDARAEAQEVFSSELKKIKGFLFSVAGGASLLVGIVLALVSQLFSGLNNSVVDLTKVVNQLNGNVAAINSSLVYLQKENEKLSSDVEKLKFKGR